MAIRYSAHAKDKFMAPFMSAFTSAEIPDMSSHCDQSAQWVSNFVLNTMFRANIENPLRQYVFNYLRRAEAAFRQHDLASKATLEFLQGSRQSPSRYMMAMFHWEVFLSQSWQGYDLLRSLAKKDLFQKGDGSPGYRLNRLNNQSKHAETEIASGNIPDDATIPVWLTNDGLSSNDTKLSFQETAEVLEELSKLAEAFQDPLTTQEKLKAMQDNSL